MKSAMMPRMATNSASFSPFWGIVLIAAAVYVALGAFTYFFQSRLLYLPDVPSRAHMATPRTLGLDYEPVKIEAGDGVTLDAWYVPAEKARGTLLFFHGNAGNISHRLQSIAIFHALRLSVLIVDYRGYGASTGEPSEEGTYADAMAAWRFLTETRGTPPGRIVLFGRSLGAAVAADLAAHHCWNFPVRWLARFRYDSRAALAAVRCPVLIVHSRQDEIVPFDHGRALFEVAREPKRFLELHGGHNDGFVVSGRTYRDGLDDFLAPLIGR